jgi:hypothetical protein
MRTPCIVITRDRLSYAKACLASLEQYAYLVDIIIVDHGSTYPPMVDWLLHESLCPVFYCGERSPRALWEWDRLRSIVGDRSYLVTDPDVVFDDACPSDWLARMDDEMHQRRTPVKVGLGLRVDDLPAGTLGGRVRAWEGAFWLERTASGRAWKAPVDTTLALYPPLSVQPGFEWVNATRLDAPYLLRHLPWYGELDAEEAAYYREHALPGATHWSVTGGW